MEGCLVHPCLETSLLTAMHPHRSLFSQHPLAQLAVAFSAGICIANYFQIKLSISLGVVCSVLALMLSAEEAIAGGWIHFARGDFLYWRSAWPSWSSGVTARSGIRNLVEQPCTLTGWLDGPPEFARDRVYLSLRVEEPAAGRVSLLAPIRNAAVEAAFKELQLRYGTRIRVNTTLERDGGYRNPGVSTLAEFLDRNGYDASGIIKSPASITRLEDTRVFPPLAWLYEWRSRLQKQIDTRFAPETAGVLDATLLGNRYNLSYSASERFREGGTFHVLVISGLHISFIGGLVFLLMRRLTRRRLAAIHIACHHRLGLFDRCRS